LKTYALLFGAGFVVFGMVSMLLNIALFAQLSRVKRPPSFLMRRGFATALGTYLARRREIGTRSLDVLCLALSASIAMTVLFAWGTIHFLDKL
jgi:hypothetical protein